MTRNSDWQRVSKRRPCPVCDRPDWCLFTGDPSNPTAVICARVESRKRCGEGGWLHVLRNDPVWAPWRRTIHTVVMKMESNGTNFARLAARYQQQVNPDALKALADRLGLSVESLTRLSVGWSASNRAWAFPMHDAAGGVLGIRLRLPNGKKLSVRGGKEGLFIPAGLTPRGRLLVTEGPTDCAALLDLGFAAVGRPSCTGGVKLLVELVTMMKPTEVVIVADADSPGQRGAESLAAVLVAYWGVLKIIAPPVGIKDAREWKRSGATTTDVQAVVDAAPIRRLGVRVRRRAVKHGS
jgi:hypothetical protein